MMDLAPILTGIAVAGLICQATAVPVPFKVEAILPQAEGAPYATMAAQIGKDMLASLIPYRVLKNGGVTYHLGDKSTPPLQVWAQASGGNWCPRWNVPCPRKFPAWSHFCCWQRTVCRRV